MNFTLSDVKTNYVHRIGRVGRADFMGLAISQLTVEEEEEVVPKSENKKKKKKVANDE